MSIRINRQVVAEALSALAQDPQDPGYTGPRLISASDVQAVADLGSAGFSQEVTRRQDSGAISTSQQEAYVLMPEEESWRRIALMHASATSQSSATGTFTVEIEMVLRLGNGEKVLTAFEKTYAGGQVADILHGGNLTADTFELDRSLVPPRSSMRVRITNNTDGPMTWDALAWYMSGPGRLPL